MEKYKNLSGISGVDSYDLYSLIILVPAVFLGKWVSKKIPAPIFIKTMYWMLIAIGISLIVESLN